MTNFEQMGKLVGAAFNQRNLDKVATPVPSKAAYEVPVARHNYVEEKREPALSTEVRTGLTAMKIMLEARAIGLSAELEALQNQLRELSILQNKTKPREEINQYKAAEPLTNSTYIQEPENTMEQTEIRIPDNYELTE